MSATINLKLDLALHHIKYIIIIHVYIPDKKKSNKKKKSYLNKKKLYILKS